jgi:hypothetical protein
VLPNHLAVPNCTSNLQSDKQITDENLQKQLNNLAIEMVRVIRGLH